MVGQWNGADRAHDSAVAGFQHPADRPAASQPLVNRVASPEGCPIFVSPDSKSITLMKSVDLPVIREGSFTNSRAVTWSSYTCDRCTVDFTSGAAQQCSF